MQKLTHKCGNDLRKKKKKKKKCCKGSILNCVSHIHGGNKKHDSSVQKPQKKKPLGRSKCR
jgi:ribosomal protein L2